ncbi:MAG: CoA pyrophosphatase, partial [Acidimicrobiia bacterium]|nr:CoA pyrophosphatase [Acidimicrobiia bacterium]
MLADFPGIRDAMSRGDGTPRAAVLVPLFADGDVIRLILTKRPMHMPTHAGDLAFPGGKPLAGETPVDTALREAHEEVGIPPASVDVIGYLPEIHTVSYTKMVVPVVGSLHDVPDLHPDPGEVEKVLLPDVDRFRESHRWRIEYWDDRPVHFFPLDGEILWGATARMVRQLVG